MTKTREKNVEGRVNVCCHHVAYRYWWSGKPTLTDDVRDSLKEDAEGRAKECIIEGYHSGELCSLVVEGDKDYEVFGWWEISRD
jgi:hypothetical protein